MTAYRRARIERRERNAQRLFWQSDEKAKEHYRAILLEFAEAEFKRSSKIPKPTIHSTIRGMPSPVHR